MNNVCPFCKKRIAHGATVCPICNSELGASDKRSTIDELIAALKEGRLEEAWGCGTAAVVSPIGRLMYNDEEFVIGGEKIGEVTQKLYDILHKVNLR